MLDSRIGRWFATDAMENKYPEHSPYNAFLNNPISYIDPDGNDILPTLLFLNSVYSGHFDNLKNSSQVYRDLLKTFNSKKYNLILDIDEDKIASGTFAMSYPPSTYSTFQKDSNGKEIPNTRKYTITSSAYQYYSNQQLGEKVKKFETDGKIYQFSWKYNDIFLVHSLIHELIHSNIQVNGGARKMFKLQNEDPIHEKHALYRTLMIDALSEYVTANNLSYTCENLEDLSWHSLEQTKVFKDHFTEIAKSNGTTYEVEVKNYQERKGKLLTSSSKASEINTEEEKK